MRKCLTLTLILALGASTRASKKDAAAFDQKLLQGTWRSINVIVDDKIVSGNFATMVIKGDEFSNRYENGFLRHGRFKLDPRANPSTIDFFEKSSAVERGIYEWKGNQLRICYGKAGKPRPKKFGGEGTTLLTFNLPKP